MSLTSNAESAAAPNADFSGLAPWFLERRPGTWNDPYSSDDCRKPAGRLSHRDALRLRRVIEASIVEIFGVPQTDLSRSSRGKARVALARQEAMYLAHVSCGLTLTDVGLIFARDRTTVAHACAVIEDRRDDPVFDRALELMEWIIPSLAGPGLLHSDQIA